MSLEVFATTNDKLLCSTNISPIFFCAPRVSWLSGLMSGLLCAPYNYLKIHFKFRASFNQKLFCSVIVPIFFYAPTWAGSLASNWSACNPTPPTHPFLLLIVAPPLFCSLTNLVPEIRLP